MTQSIKAVDRPSILQNIAVDPHVVGVRRVVILFRWVPVIVVCNYGVIVVIGRVILDVVVARSLVEVVVVIAVVVIARLGHRDRR